MPNSKTDRGRRRALKIALQSVAGVSISSLGLQRRDGQFCENGNLIQSKQGDWRPCSIFPGKLVNENGWCKAWVGRI